MSLDGLTLSDVQRNSLEEATLQYEKNIDQAASYLAGRGVSRETAYLCRLGVACEPVAGHERFRNWLSIPYLTDGGVVAMKFRCLDDESDRRYDAPGGFKIRLYNARACAQGGDVVLVCEGEMDTLIALSQLGVPAVGTWGTNWMPHWPRCLADFDRVVVIADHDQKDDGSSPGLKHADKVARSISGAEKVLPPPGLDLGEWIAAEGPDPVKKACGLQ